MTLVNHGSPTELQLISDFPYEPPFPMPDHKVLGSTLLGLAQSHLFDDAAEIYFNGNIESQIDVQDFVKSSNSCDWEKVELPPLGMYSPVDR